MCVLHKITSFTWTVVLVTTNLSSLSVLLGAQSYPVFLDIVEYTLVNVLENICMFKVLYTNTRLYICACILSIYRIGYCAI